MKIVERNERGLIKATGKYCDGAAFENKKEEKFKVIGRCENSSTHRYVQFYEHPMQYITLANITSIKNGSVKNPYYPTIFGVGYLGEGYAPSHKLYLTWYKMMERCYNEQHNRYYCYGAVGVRVDSEWHNFSYFVEDMLIGKVKGAELIQQSRMVKDYYEKGGVRLNLDKDIKSTIRTKEGKGLLYSRDTVSVVTNQENNIERGRRMKNSRLKQEEIQL